jgi:hypothetical protein
MPRRDVIALQSSVELLDRAGMPRVREGVCCLVRRARHAVALANGTLALDVALKALGIGPWR